METRVIVDPDDFVEVEVPSFSDDDGAIQRSRRMRRGELPTVVMGPSFEGPISGLRGIALGEILPLTLTSALAAWQEHWEENWTLNDGWRSEQAHTASRAVGDSLYPLLVEALWDGYIVVPRF